MDLTNLDSTLFTSSPLHHTAIIIIQQTSWHKIITNSLLWQTFSTEFVGEINAQIKQLCVEKTCIVVNTKAYWDLLLVLPNRNTMGYYVLFLATGAVIVMIGYMSLNPRSVKSLYKMVSVRKLVVRRSLIHTVDEINKILQCLPLGSVRVWSM